MAGLRGRGALLAFLLVAAGCGDNAAADDDDITTPPPPPPPCDHTARPARGVRVFAIGHKVLLDEAVSYESYEAAYRAVVARDVVPNLAADRPNLLVLPENAGLTGPFIGERGAEARSQSGAAAAFLALIVPWQAAFDYYAGVDPLATLGKQVLLATTDVTWRAFERTFAGIARDHQVYVVASVDVGDAVEVDDPDLAAALGDPERPGAAPAYRAADGKVYNQAILYGPDGELIARMRKVYLTDPEHADLGIDGHLPERLGPIDVAGLGALSSLISRDAWMPDVQERVALAGAEIVLQHEAFSTWTVAPDGHPWPADNLKRSSWTAVQKHPEIRLAAAPMWVGNFFDISFDGQTFIAAKGVSSGERGALLAQDGDTGWAAVGPWVAEEPATGTLEERRAALRAIGESLLPGGQRENEFVASTVWIDLDIPADDGYPVVDVAPGAGAPALGGGAPVAPSGVGRQRWAAPVALADGSAAVAWEDTRYCTGQIVFARADGGAFPSPVRIAPWDRPQHTPSLVALPDDTLVVAWQEVMGAGSAGIRVARSEDRGESWSPPVRVDAEATIDAWKPSLAADPVSGDLYLAFVDTRGEPANRRVYLARSTDRGDTWSPPARVDAREPARESPDRTLGNEWSPQVAARGGRVVVAYTQRRHDDAPDPPDDDVFLVESEDAGRTFSAPRSFDDGGAPERRAADLALAMDEEGWLLAFSTHRGAAADAQVAFVSSRDDALRFAPDADPARDQWWPTVAPLGGGEWALAWQDFRSGGNDIYLARWDGSELGGALRADDGGDSDAQAWRPRAAAGMDGTLQLFWEDSRSGHAELRAASGRIAP